MKFLEALDELEESPIFLNWKEENKAAYLAHGFAIIESDGKEKSWQIGYYSKDTDRLTVFNVMPEDISKEAESEVFKEEEKKVQEIKREFIETTITKALLKAEEIQQSKYSGHPPLKKIVILQNLPVGQIWNITYVTQSFATLNIKIDTKTGEVLSDELVSLIQMTDPKTLKEELKEKINNKKNNRKK